MTAKPLPNSWIPPESERMRIVIAMLKLCRAPQAPFRVIWSVGRYGLIVSNEPEDERRLIYWREAVELTSEAAQAVEKRIAAKSAPQRKRKEAAA